MDNTVDPKIYGATLEEFGKSFTPIVRSLPPEKKKKLADIQMKYFGQYGIEESYRRLNDRTVEQILPEYVETDLPPTASGHVDGLSFVLYDPPRSEDK